MKSGEEIEAVIQEIGVDSVRYTRASNPGGPAYTVPKSEIFMIRYANGERDIFADNQKPSSGGFGGSSTGDYKKHRFGASLGIGGLKSETDTDSLTAIEFGGSYTYMFRSSLGVTFNLRPFFGWYVKDNFKQDDGGFQALAGIRYIFPAIYTTAGGREINPYAAGKIGIGYLSGKRSLEIKSGSGKYASTIVTETNLAGTGVCFELELGVEMDSHLYIAFVYNFQGGDLKGKMTVTMSVGDYEGDPVSTNAIAQSTGGFIGFRIGYQF
jgi:hypothetical protein